LLVAIAWQELACRFFSSLAFELELGAQWHDVHDVERDLTEYIDRYYNPIRRHSHNSYLSPH